MQCVLGWALLQASFTSTGVRQTRASGYAGTRREGQFTLQDRMQARYCNINFAIYQQGCTSPEAS